MAYNCTNLFANVQESVDSELIKGWGAAFTVGSIYIDPFID